MNLKWKWKFRCIIALLLLSLLAIASFATANTVNETATISGNSHTPPPLPPGWEQDKANWTSMKEKGLLENTPKTLLADNVIALQSGWNMISVPKWLNPPYNTGMIFSDVNMGGRNAWIWDSSLNPQQWVPVYSNTPIQPLVGIWIYSTTYKEVTLHYNPVQSYPAKALYPGWNAVGFWDLEPLNARDVMISVDPSWSQMMGYNAILQQYEQTIFNGDPSQFTTLNPTKGYWLYTNNPATLTPLAGTKDNQDSTFPQVGIEWGEAYTTPSAHLYWSQETSENFANTLSAGAGWKKMFNYGDAATQPAHFYPGTNKYYIDGVDFAYYCGHSGNWALNLPTLRFATFGYSEWGTNDLEWIILQGCHSTQIPSYFKNGLYRTMNGVHLVCGYYTESFDVENGVLGTNVANRLLQGQSIYDAWRLANDELYGPDVTIRVLGEDDNCLNDHIFGHGYIAPNPVVDGAYSIGEFQCTL